MWLLGLLALLLAPLSVYWGIQLLTFSHPSPYPEIDAAWKIGVEALAIQNLEVADVPLILVLGTKNLADFQNFHGGTRGKGKGAAKEVQQNERDWLYWAMENDSLYLHLPQCCHLAQGTATTNAAVAHYAGTAAAPLGLDGFGEDSVPWTSQDPFAGTSKIGGPDDGSLPMGTSVPMGFGGTSDPFADAGFADEPDDFFQNKKNVGELADIQLPQSDMSDRLSYLFKLIRKAAPTSVSPHGILVNISKDVLADDSRSRDLAQRLERDLVQINRVSQTHLPLTFLFSGFENDKGFVKLATALTKSMPKATRFGVGTDRTEMPEINHENIDILAKRLVAYVDSHVFNVLGSESQLSKYTENRELFRFAFSIRSQFARRLTELLKRVLLSPELQEDPVYLLGGCYLCALASKPGERTFYLDGTKQKVSQIFELADFSAGRRHWDRIQKVVGIGLMLASIGIWATGVVLAAWQFGWFSEH